MDEVWKETRQRLAGSDIEVVTREGVGYWRGIPAFSAASVHFEHVAYEQCAGCGYPAKRANQECESCGRIAS